MRSARNHLMVAFFDSVDTYVTDLELESSAEKLLIEQGRNQSTAFTMARVSGTRSTMRTLNRLRVG
jgi:hypothetical protein